MSELRFRDLHTADEFRQVMALEQEVWGFTDLNDMVTVPVFTITTKRGAILIGAYDAADRMVGFVYSIVGMKGRQVLQWSHMLGVLTEYANSGLGRHAEARPARAGAGPGLRAHRVDVRPAAGAERAPELHQARRRRRGVPPQRLRRVDQRAAQGHAHRPPGGAVVDRPAARRAAGRRRWSPDRREPADLTEAAPVNVTRPAQAGSPTPTSSWPATSGGWCSRFRWASPTCSATRLTWRSSGGCRRREIFETYFAPRLPGGGLLPRSAAAARPLPARQGRRGEPASAA